MSEHLSAFWWWWWWAVAGLLASWVGGVLVCAGVVVVWLLHN